MSIESIFNDSNILTVPDISRTDPFNSSNITMSGNGYLGFRGTFPDWKKDRYTACTVSDTYDLADGKWKELCNVPNALFCKASEDGRIFDLNDNDCKDIKHSIDYKYGITSGSARWKLKNIKENSNTDLPEIEISWERFPSYSDLHLIAQKISIITSSDTILDIETGIDGNVWSLNGSHFSSLGFYKKDNCTVCKALTTEKKMPVFVFHNISADGAEGDSNVSNTSLFTNYRIKAQAGKTVELIILMSVYTANDSENPEEDAEKSIIAAREAGWGKLLNKHKSAWDKNWELSYTHITGDETADRLLKYNMYHNFISTPAHTDSLPIGARGLSCQAYQGAAFWDQEIFNLPMYLFTRSDIARNLLVYRYKTMRGAKNKAARLGYAGAFYAWISGDTGEELCPDYFFKDVITGRKIRNHFNDWQIHISPDIAYTIIKYYEITADWKFLKDYGIEMLLEISLFIYSRAHYNSYRDEYEILKVLGPDEYHENADNNAFTNRQAEYVLRKTIEMALTLKKSEPDKLDDLLEKTGITEHILNGFEYMSEKLYQQEPDPDTSIIEQFDGYFQLEDITPEELSKRLIDDQEYWGWPNGIAYETQVMKQADVIQMFMLHDYPEDVMKKNYLYYEPRTQHRSSLSPGVHSIIAARCGLTEQAYEYFIKSSSVDAVNSHPPSSGGTFIGGIHTAACGIAWQIITLGFAGLKIREDGISLSPKLPEKWKAIEFRIVYRNVGMNVKITNSEASITTEADYASPVNVYGFGKAETIMKKGSIEL